MGFRCPNCKTDFGTNEGSKEALDFHFVSSERCLEKANWAYALRVNGFWEDEKMFDGSPENLHKSILNHEAILERERNNILERKWNNV